MNSSGSCSFFVKKKRKLCKMKTVGGMTFCPHHSYLTPEQTTEKGMRIPCPFDPLHFCYLSKLEKHKKKCNSREKELPLFHKKNINSGLTNRIVSKITISDVSDEELIQLINKVEKSYADLVPPLSRNDLVHPTLQEEIEKSNDAITSFKHIKQQSSLLALMDKFNLLSSGSCFIEFGAGRGHLMYWIITCIEDKENKTFVLVDKEARRYKKDNKFRQNNEIDIERIRIDIEHLFLGEVDSIKKQSEKVVGVSKHLCGAATDLSLKCLMETIKSEVDGQEVKKLPLGIVMALCCHHQCTWESYVGKDFFLKNGFCEKEFQLMCGLASWATCGLKKKSMEKDSLCDNIDDKSHGEQINRYVKLSLEHEKREEIGRKCKRLIDVGRMHYLQQFGLLSELIMYVDNSVSLENIALVGLLKP